MASVAEKLSIWKTSENSQTLKHVYGKLKVSSILPDSSPNLSLHFGVVFSLLKGIWEINKNTNL